MYKSVKRISFLRGVTNDGVILSPGAWNWSQIFRNTSGLKEDKAETLKEIQEEISFSSFVLQRQEQARRSVVVQISEFKQWENLVQLCSNFGNINKVFHYELDKSNFLVVEMSKEEELNNLLKSTQDKKASLNNYKHFLQFNSKRKIEHNTPPELLEKVSLKVLTGVNYESVLKKELKKKLSISNHFQQLYDTMKVNDLGMRLRFLTCRQIEHLLSGLLPNCTVYPFGSSVSGFGINGCDLDLVVLPENTDKITSCNNNNNCLNIDRSLVQTHLVVVSELFKQFLMGCRNTVCIKNATVPIIKFKQAMFGLDCDLSLYNTHGVSTAQMLFILSSFDECVKPLVFGLRLWAKNNGLVSKYPGPSISNFSLTLLILFFLQQSGAYSASVLPPWSAFPESNLFLLSDEEVVQGVIEYKEKLKMNNFSLEKLIYLFFEFYSTFDFKNKGISLRTGKAIINLHKIPLYIENPLIPSLNVSKNVLNLEVLKFQNFCTVAYEILEDESVPDTLKFTEIFNVDNYRMRKKKKLQIPVVRVAQIFEET